MSGEVWGGIAGFVALSGGLVAIWRALAKEIREIRDNHLRHTDEKINAIGTRLDQTDQRIARVDERLKGAKSELWAAIRASEGRVKADIRASEGRLHAAIEGIRRSGSYSPMDTTLSATEAPIWRPIPTPA